MRLRRRDLLLGTLTSLGMAAVLPACSSGETTPTGGADAGAQEIGSLPVAEATFAHGVASGDPLADRVILWTRVTTTVVQKVTEALNETSLVRDVLKL